MDNEGRVVIELRLDGIIGNGTIRRLVVPVAPTPPSPSSPAGDYFDLLKRVAQEMVFYELRYCSNVEAVSSIRLRYTDVDGRRVWFGSNEELLYALWEHTNNSYNINSRIINDGEDGRGDNVDDHNNAAATAAFAVHVDARIMRDFIVKLRTKEASTTKGGGGAFDHNPLSRLAASVGMKPKKSRHRCITMSMLSGSSSTSSSVTPFDILKQKATCVRRKNGSGGKFRFARFVYADEDGDEVCIASNEELVCAVRRFLAVGSITIVAIVEEGDPRPPPQTNGTRAVSSTAARLAASPNQNGSNRQGHSSRSNNRQQRRPVQSNMPKNPRPPPHPRENGEIDVAEDCVAEDNPVATAHDPPPSPPVLAEAGLSAQPHRLSPLSPSSSSSYEDEQWHTYRGNCDPLTQENADNFSTDWGPRWAFLSNA